MSSASHLLSSPLHSIDASLQIINSNLKPWRAFRAVGIDPKKERSRARAICARAQRYRERKYVEELEQFVREEAAAKEAAKEAATDGDGDSDIEGDEDEFEFEVDGSVCSVGLGNRDLARIVNGSPNDPIELRPYDYIFTLENIIATWIKVGFMPMTANAVNDPKVMYELGEGGALEDASRRLKLLVKDYEAIATKLTRMGFNGDVLDLRPRQVKEDDDEIPEDEEKTIQYIIDNKLLNKAGGLFKCGLSIANCRVITEAGRRMAELEKKKKEEKTQKQSAKATQSEWDAFKLYDNWKRAGKPMADGKPKFASIKNAITILKVLLPKVAPKEKITDYNSGKKALERLVKIAGGSTWETEMDHISAQREEKMAQELAANPRAPMTTARLF